MNFLGSIIAVLVLAATSKACVVDVDKSWAYHYVDFTYDSATTNVPLNDKYNCFDFCPETGVTMTKFLVKSSPGRTVATVERTVAQPDSTGNSLTCTDGTLRDAIAQSLNKLTKFTAKDIATSLQYSLNKPGWVINVFKHQWESQAVDGTMFDTNFCQYETTVHGDFVTIQMGLVDINPKL